MDDVLAAGFGPGDNWCLYGSDETAPTGGLYKCEGCPREVTVKRGQAFPGADHHSHVNGQAVKWRLWVKVRY